jgi:arginine decarboxylase
MNAEVSLMSAASAQYHSNEVHSFHMPGHKQRVEALHPDAQQLFGTNLIANDLSEMGGFDYLHAPESSIVAAQQRAAEVFGAARTWFLVNGSTGGNLAVVTALLGDGQRIAMLRASHRSVYGGVVLAGADPVYVPMVHNLDEDGWFLGDASILDSFAPGDVDLLHLTRPNYYGMAVDLDVWVAAARRLDVALVVDEAHGSHFAFDDRLPASALSLGADITIQSTHKTLGGLTQASMLHVSERGLRWADRLTRSLQQLQSSSPSALLTMSLGLAADHLRAEHKGAGQITGRSLVSQAVDLSEVVARHIPSPLRLVKLPGVATDPTKIVLDTRPLAMTGFEAAQWLRSERRLWVELADQQRIVCSLSMGDSEESVNALVDALRDLAALRGKGSAGLSPTWVASTPALSPRRASQSPVESVPLSATLDRVAAEYLIPYPPGIPLVVPGETLTAEVLATLEQYRSIGSRIVGPADGSLATLMVVVP